MLNQATNHLKKATVCIVMLGSIITSPAAFSASDAECSIWLCLPTGFGQGCSEAKDAFKDRIKHFKSPLPDLAGCMISGGGDENYNINSKEGVAAFIPEREVCAKKEKVGGRDGGTKCVEYKTLESKIIKDTSCFIPHSKNDHQPRKPKNCSHTLRYVETFMNGKPLGTPHYY